MRLTFTFYMQDEHFVTARRIMEIVAEQQGIDLAGTLTSYEHATLLTRFASYVGIRNFNGVLSIKDLKATVDATKSRNDRFCALIEAEVTNASRTEQAFPRVDELMRNFDNARDAEAELVDAHERPPEQVLLACL